MNKITIYIIMLLLIFTAVGHLPNVKAEITPDFVAEVETAYNVTIPCDEQGYFCASNVLCNSSLSRPDSSLIINNRLATLQGNFILITLNSTEINTIGDYYGDVKCNNPSNGLNGSTSFTLRVTQTGTELSTWKSILYVLILAMSVLFLGGLIYFGIFIPYDNPRDQFTGYILAVENLKYLKIFCWGLAYLTVMVIAYFSYLISFAYLEMSVLGNIFRFVFYAFLAGLFPLFVFGTYIVGANLVRDSKIGEALTRGLRVK